MSTAFAVDRQSAGSSEAAGPKTPMDGVDFNHVAAAHVQIIDAAQAVVRTTPRRRKLGIVGFSTASRDSAPYADPDWELWGLNQLYRHIPRADRWFEIHHNWNEHVVEGTDHLGWIKQAPIPVYMVEPLPGCRSTVRYPVERMVAKFGDYFTSTIAFMLALAIDEIDEMVGDELNAMPADALSEYRHTPSKLRDLIRDLYSRHFIGIWGVDLIVGQEWFYQKACTESLIGEANGRGITVYIPAPSALMKQSHRYGYASEPAAFPIKKSMLEERIAGLTKQKHQLLANLGVMDGAIQDCEYWLSVFELRERGGKVGG